VTAPPAALAEALRDRYILERELGRGGMATVYLALDVKHNRRVALKVLHPELAGTIGPDRFLHEIKLTASLDHPHILPVLDSGEAAGRLWYTMPYVRGESLRDRLRREVQLSVEAAVGIVRQVASALDYAHREGVVHRDLKPENILLSEDQVRVADFGIAKALGSAGEARLTETGLSLGTPHYMSPEQASGERGLDGRADVYALGCVLYELLAGEPPFSGSTARAILARHAVDPVPAIRTVRPGVPAHLEQTINRALQKVPADRFATAGDFLRAVLGDTPVVIGPQPGSAVPAREPRRISLRHGLLAAAVLLAVGGLVGLSIITREAAGPAGPKMVVVLPFRNLGPASDQYFADGLADEIANRLASVPGLGVISRASAQQYRNTTKPLKQIARELGVAYVIDGSVRWERLPGGRSRARVTPQLLQVSDDRQLWTNRYDEELADIFAVQARIAEGIAGALHLSLGTSERRRMADAPTTDLEAYDAYLRGNELFYETRATLPALIQAVQHYRRAVALDSSFALAWARLSQAISALVYPSLTAGYADSASARVAAERAIALEPELADGYIALALYNPADSRAGALFQRARELNPHNPRMLIYFAEQASARGQAESALAYLQAAQRYNPRSVDVLRAIALRLVGCGKVPRGLVAFDQALAVAPNDPETWRIKAGVYLAQTDTAGFWSTLRRGAERVDPVTYVAHLAVFDDMFFALSDEQQRLLLQLSPNEPFGHDTLSWGLALAGTALLRRDTVGARRFADAARRVAEQRIAAGESRADLRTYLSLAYAHMGRYDEAVRVGLRAMREPTPNAYPIYNQFQLVRVYVLAERYDEALDALKQFVQMGGADLPQWGGGSLPGLWLDPRLEPLRRLPRFERTITAAWDSCRANHPTPQC
jgi:eukaryotic-like serine/threonine-protein kinase